MSECTGCRSLIKIQPPCTGSVIKQVQIILKHGKKQEKNACISALGGDPVYTYSATAPLPENINEYILAGFLRKKKVKMVKCITNDLYVPSDADIVIEGYVDPAEELVWEGHLAIIQDFIPWPTGIQNFMLPV